MKERKANLDLLRVLAMFGIVMFHHFGTRIPGLFTELPPGFDTASYFYDVVNNVPGAVAKTSLLSDFIYGHFGCGGNYVFMLVTGWFLFGREYPLPKRVRKAGSLLFALVFHGILLTLVSFAVARWFRPARPLGDRLPVFTLPNWLSGDNRWYLQAYGVFILAVVPLLKLFEKKLTRTTHLYLALTLVFLKFLAYRSYLNNLWISSSLLDFVTFYYLGGYVAAYGVRVSRKKLLAAALVYVVAWFLYEWYWRYANAVRFDPADYSYVEVHQPAVCCFVFAVLCFLLAVKTDVRPGRLSKLLSSLSTSTVGIYVFHYSVVTLSFALAGTFWWHDWSRKGFFLFAIVDSVALFFLSWLLDLARKRAWEASKKALSGAFGDGPA